MIDYTTSEKLAGDYYTHEIAALSDQSKKDIYNHIGKYLKAAVISHPSEEKKDLYRDSMHYFLIRDCDRKFTSSLNSYFKKKRVHRLLNILLRDNNNKTPEEVLKILSRFRMLDYPKIKKAVEELDHSLSFLKNVNRVYFSNEDLMGKIIRTLIGVSLYEYFYSRPHPFKTNRTEHILSVTRMGINYGIIYLVDEITDSNFLSPNDRENYLYLISEQIKGNEVNLDLLKEKNYVKKSILGITLNIIRETLTKADEVKKKETFRMALENLHKAQTNDLKYTFDKNFSSKEIDGLYTNITLKAAYTRIIAKILSLTPTSDSFIETQIRNGLSTQLIDDFRDYHPDKKMKVPTPFTLYNEQHALHPFEVFLLSSKEYFSINDKASLISARRILQAMKEFKLKGGHPEEFLPHCSTFGPALKNIIMECYEQCNNNESFENMMSELVIFNKYLD